MFTLTSSVESGRNQPWEARPWTLLRLRVSPGIKRRSLFGDDAAIVREHRRSTFENQIANEPMIRPPGFLSCRLILPKGHHQYVAVGGMRGIKRLNRRHAVIDA